MVSIKPLNRCACNPHTCGGGGGACFCISMAMVMRQLKGPWGCFLPLLGYDLFVSDFTSFQSRGGCASRTSLLCCCVHTLFLRCSWGPKVGFAADFSFAYMYDYALYTRKSISYLCSDRVLCVLVISTVDNNQQQVVRRATARCS